MRSQMCCFRLWAAVLSMVLTVTFQAYADEGEPSKLLIKPGMWVVKSTPTVSQPLGSLAPLPVESAVPSAALTFQDLPFKNPNISKLPESGEMDASIVQMEAGIEAMPVPTANFEGISNNDNALKVYPPDPQGDIGYDPDTGKKYYVQWVNLSFRIWDVTDPAAPLSLYGPAAGNTLWTGFGGVCETHNDGYPLTRFDSISKRWVMSQFTYTPNPPYDFHQCVAVSTGADPTGAWYRYDFPISTTVMNDYSKIGIWPDGYYMSFNQFDGGTFAYKGVGVAAFERAKMLNGLPARMIYIDVGAANPDYFGMLPSDLDGVPPAAGTPNYFAEWDDSATLGDTWDTLRIWEFHADWTTPANSTFGVGGSHLPNRLIPTGNVDTELCNLANNKCIPQPGTAQKLDAISDRLMYRLQYRNFGDHQTLVGNHTVDVSGADRAGIHWFELRNSGSGFAMYQQGVYAPYSDSDNRWMGSAAMDASGNIALGYSVSSSSTYPSIRYTGRLSTDSLNTLPQGEVSLIAGSGSQTGSAGRWGDYSMMAVDPVDGCTFWYTQEYVQTTGIATWQTRIASFRFPGCTTLPPGILSGTVTSGGSTPVAGATVTATGVNFYSTVTDGTGHYSFNPASGTYNVTVSKYGYVTATATGVVVSGPSTTTQDFALTALANYTISGVVRDAGTSWPLYARINITGYPGGPVYTDPVTGAYSVVLANGGYTFNVTAMSGGYTVLSQPVTVSTSATQNFPLAVACPTPGYVLNYGYIALSDGFDTSTAPSFSAAWAKADVSGTAGDWQSRTSTMNPSGILPHSPPNLAYFNSYSVSTGSSTRLYRTAGLDLSSLTNGEVSLWMYHDTGYPSANDTLHVQLSTDSGTTWNSVGSPIPRYNGATGWARHGVDISAYTGTGMTDVRLGLLGTSQFGNDIHIDDIIVSNVSQCTPMATGGLVIGSVKDANTGTVITDASVKDSGNYPATMIDSSADHARPSRMYVIGQPAGPVTLVGSAPDYQTGQATVQVLAGNTVGKDIPLAAGRFSANPAGLSFTVTKDAPSLSQPFSLKNNGGISADYRIFATSGVYTPPLATGPFADNTAKTETKGLIGEDAPILPLPPALTEIEALAGGDVSRTISVSALSLPFGIGFNTTAGDFWVGDYANDRDYRFTTSGTGTGDSIDIAPWAFSTYGGDMTYNPFTNRLWQSNWGGDNCIYELDPVAKVSTGNRICPPFGTSQVGLAFDPVTNTYYSGSWNNYIINHFAPDGTILDSKSFGLPISGLAINPVTGHLFVMTNVPSAAYPQYFDIYVLDARNSYSGLGGFDLKIGGVEAFAGAHQAGLEMDCNGNLWAVDYMARKVYVAPSGETGACGWKAAWLSATPSSGTVTAGGTASLVVGVNATAVSEGVHNGYLRVENSTPYGSLILPVTLTVKSKLTVTRSGTGSGTVISSPSGINCGADCTEQYLPNTVVSLSAAAATYSTFTRWSGNPDCVDGIVTMDTSKSCNGVFTITPIRIPDQYSTIQAAYNALLNNGSIQSLVRTYIENVHFNRSINATLSGGYLTDWTAASGMTTIQGSLAIEKGSAVISNVVIK